MAAFELLVYDEKEAFDDVPTTLITVQEWLSERPFPLTAHGTVGLRIGDGKNSLAVEAFGRIRETATGCHAAAKRLAEGRMALLRTTLDDPGVYLLMSAEDPVRVSWIHERPTCNDVYPFSPGRMFDPPDGPQLLYAWAEAEAARLLAPSGNPAHDRSRGLLLRMPRSLLIADLKAQAALAEALLHALS